jgi:large conductance mechanosensitive channel
MPSQSLNRAAAETNRVVHGVRKELGGFKKFLVRGNVVDLAIGVVIGAAFSNIVQALVKDIITPLIGLFGGVPNAATWTVVIAGQTFQIGDVVNALISFVLIAAIVYFLVVLPINRLMDRYRPEPKPAPTKECPECLSAIPQDARRCRECGVQLAPPSEEVAAAMQQMAAPSGATIADQAARVLSERLSGTR